MNRFEADMRSYEQTQMNTKLLENLQQEAKLLLG